jgi:tetratricopeptide (TPR) repeat protein
MIAANLIREFGHSDFVLSWCRKARSLIESHDRSCWNGLAKLEVSILQDQGSLNEVVPMLDDLISSSGGENKSLLTISLFERGSALNSLGRYDEGLRDLLRAEKLAREIGDSRLIAKVALERGHAALHLRDVETAEEQLRTAENASRAGGDNVILASALDSLGAILMARGDHAKALRLFEDEAAICRECSDQIGLARALTATGNVMGRMPIREHAAVFQLFDEAERLCQTTSNPIGQACAIGSRGRHLRRLGRFTEALACQVAELAIWEKVNTPIYIASCLLEQSATHYAMRNMGEAKRCLDAANAIREHLGGPRQEDLDQVAKALLGEQVFLPKT